MFWYENIPAPWVDVRAKRIRVVKALCGNKFNFFSSQKENSKEEVFWEARPRVMIFHEKQEEIFIIAALKNIWKESGEEDERSMSLYIWKSKSKHVGWSRKHQV
jgi:hypothetical protein